MVAGCESSSRNMVGPSATKCELSIAESPPPLGSAGGSGNLPVTAARECTWSATTPTPWITISQGSGQGDGLVQFSVAANPATSRRQGELVIGDQRTGIIQEGSSCVFAVAPTTYGLGADGGVFSVAVHTAESCTWTAAEDVPWAAVVDTSNFTGPGTVRVRVDENAEGNRRATLLIAGQTITVDQAGASAECRSTVAPAEASVPAAGGALIVNVTATSDCQWTAASQNAWIAVTSGLVGRGPGTVALTVAPNQGVARVGTVVIASRTFTITQEGPAPTCSYSLAPPAQSLGAGGGDAAVNVTAPDGCAWSAVSQVSWIRVTAGDTGSGAGTVSLAIDANPGAERVGTVTIGGQVFTVTQAVATVTCSYRLSPAAQSLGPDGGAASFNVTAPEGCAWSAASQVAWITVAAGGTGSGEGTVGLTVAANPGAERVGTVTIGGQVFTVTQAAATVVCSYGLSSPGQLLGATGGAASVNVTAPGGCGWTAASQVSWITVSSGASGSGNGTVSLSVASNTVAERVGTVHIGDQVFTVTQAAAAPACTYTVTPLSQSVPLLSLGSFTATVDTRPGCAWTASSQVSWITIVSGSSGSGGGTVTYRVGNLQLLGTRTGTIAIAGATLTVHQSGLLQTPQER
jgi:hypothetical protein